MSASHTTLREKLRIKAAAGRRKSENMSEADRQWWAKAYEHDGRQAHAEALQQAAVEVMLGTEMDPDATAAQVLVAGELRRWLAYDPGAFQRGRGRPADDMEGLRRAMLVVWFMDHGTDPAAINLATVKLQARGFDAVEARRIAHESVKPGMLKPAAVELAAQRLGLTAGQVEKAYEKHRVQARAMLTQHAQRKASRTP